jgi:TRAP-type C4-dicarboxylate transport system permease small subunit
MDEPAAARERAPAAFRWLTLAELTVVGVGLIASLLVTAATIVERNLGHSTGDWTLKLPELILIWMTFLGMGALVTERGHVGADMLLRQFSPLWQRIAETASSVIAGAVLAMILVGAISIVRQQVAAGATDDELGGISEGLVFAVMPAGLALTILHLLGDIYTIWRPRPRA